MLSIPKAFLVRWKQCIHDYFVESKFTTEQKNMTLIYFSILASNTSPEHPSCPGDGGVLWIGPRSAGATSSGRCCIYPRVGTNPHQRVFTYPKIHPHYPGNKSHDTAAVVNVLTPELHRLFSKKMLQGLLNPMICGKEINPLFRRNKGIVLGALYEKIKRRNGFKEGINYSSFHSSFVEI